MMHNNIQTENIIRVNGDQIFLDKTDENIDVILSDKLDFYDIVKIDINILKDTSLLIYYEGKNEIKLDVSITVRPSLKLDFKEVRTSLNYKIQEKFYLYDKADVSVEKFYDTLELKELNIFFLNGVGVNLTSKIHGLVKEKSKLDVLVYHNFPRTNSDLKHHFVTIKQGTIQLNVTGMVYQKIKGCVVNQENHIVNQNGKDSIIKPNLLIEENDIEASHSANIAPFANDILFYMQSRGISKKEAEKMLLKGFLQNDLVEIDKIMKKYWR